MSRLSSLPRMPVFLLFILSGGINTLVTYGAYLLFLQVVSYQLSYAIAYFLGIVLAYILNLRFVFNTKSSFRKILRYPLIYLVQYVLGAGLLYLLVSVLGLSSVFAPLFVIMLLLPVTFLMNKKVLAENDDFRDL